MKAYVVDTNVPVVANGRTPQAGPGCAAACVEALGDIKEHGLIVLDDRNLILDEYMKNLSLAGQPGLGDAFMKWVFESQAVPERCEQVPITPRGGADDDFEEFPDAPALRAFDRSDRKFVAVALTSRRRPVIQDAVDSDWWDYRRALRQHGARIQFLCPEQFRGE